MTVREKIKAGRWSGWWPIWASAITVILAVQILSQPSSANAAAQQAAAAAARGLTCTQTDKSNGGFILDCDPGGPSSTPSPSNSASPSSTPTVSPSVSPSPSTSSPTPTASPSNSSTGGPSTPPPTPQNNCQASPSRCGFPDDISTGASAAAGTVILNGDQTFRTAGQTIANTTINGCVEVRAANVTFRNVKINGPGCFWVVQNFASGLQVIDSTISGAGGNGTCIGSSGLSLLRVELTGCENGLNVSGTTTVTDSWIHGLTTANGAHTDGAQFNQGASDILFQHNTIVVAAPGGTSAIIMWDEGGAQNARVTIASNLLAGGTYTLYCGREGAVDNVRIINNRFGNFEFGYANACNSGEVWTNNVKDSTDAQLVAA